ncbi:MAG: hypothetical protein C4297_14485 [Gemmataceae bacterium]
MSVSPSAPHGAEQEQALHALMYDPAKAPDAAWAAIGSLVERLALKQGQGLNKQIIADCLAELPSKVCLALVQGQFEPKPGPLVPQFVAWVKRLIINKYKDLLREKKRRRELCVPFVGDDDEVGTWMQLAAKQATAPIFDRADALDAADLHLDVTMPFCEEDLRIIETWKPTKRIVLLIGTALYRKVPEHLWIAWVEESDLEMPFPNTDLWQMTVIDRLRYLARALGMLVNTVLQIWRRGQQALQCLRFVRELISEA